MDLRARLRQLADALPPSGSVVLTRADLVALLEEGGVEEELGVDLTVDQVAERLGRAPSTVRNWLSEKRLPGAYRFRNREWRIPAGVLRTFLEAEAAGGSKRVSRREPAADPAAWRKHLRRAG